MFEGIYVALPLYKINKTSLTKETKKINKQKISACK